MAACSPASTIKIISDAVNPAAETTLDGAVGATIDNALRVAAAVTIVRTEKATVTLNAVINGQTDPIEIIQSGGNLKLDDVMLRLDVLGYRAVAISKKAGRVGGQDRVTLTIAWNTI